MNTMQNITLENTEFKGAAWFDPRAKRFYGGRIGDYRGGILVDVSTIQATNVLAELLGLARPNYTLDAAVRAISTPELVLSVDTEAVGAGNEKLSPLEESLISEKTFSRVNLECDLNEVHIVVEDRAAMKASHDVLSLNIADAALEIARMRNSQIADIVEAATQATVTGEEWDDVTAGVSDHNPLHAIAASNNEIIANGYMPNFIALNYSDWANFITNTHIAPMVQAGILTINGGNAHVSLPGFPNLQVLLDNEVTAGVAVLGASRGTLLADGPTESVRYRNELKRYTGYIIRQYMQPKIAVAGAVRHFHII
jgi:hypothetical protein